MTQMTTTQILLVSDTHCHEYPSFGSIDSKTGLNTRLLWSTDIFDQILEYGETHGVRTLLIGGDVFEVRGTISVKTYDLVYSKLLRLLDHDWEVVSIVGNHDQAVKSGEIHALKPLPVRVVDSHEVIELRNGLRVGCVSYCENTADFLAKLEVVSSADIFLLHQGINGAKIAGDEILSRDETDLGAVLEHTQGRPVYIGHYHTRQSLGQGVRYIGSATPKNFEDSEPKGFLKVTWTPSIKNDQAVDEFIPGRAPRFVTFDLTKDDSVQMDNAVIDGNYVRLLTGDLPEEKVLSLQKNLTANGCQGFVVSKVSDWTSDTQRLEVQPESNPLEVVKKYLAKMIEENRLPEGVEPTELLDVLNASLEGVPVMHTVGGKRISIDSVSMANFMSYEHETLSLQDAHGLILIDGRNLDDPATFSNGSGKSTIGEAIKWALFGVTTRGIRSDEVVTENSKESCHVQLRFQVDKETYVLTRTRKGKGKNPNAIVLAKLVDNDLVDLRGKSDADTQEIIESLLGIDVTTFDAIACFSLGFTRSFATMTDKEQKEVIETILGIEYYSEVNAILRDKLKTVSEELSACKIRRGQLEYTINKLQDKIEEIKGIAASFEADIKRRVEHLEAGLKMEQAELLSLEKVVGLREVETELRELTELMVQSKGLEDERSEIRIELLQTKNEIKSLEEESARLTVSADRLNLEADRHLKSISEGVCPMCRQPLSEDQEVAKHKGDRLMREAAELSARGNQIKARLPELAVKRSDLEKAFEEVGADLQDFEVVRNRKADLERQLSETAKIESKKENLRACIKRSESMISQLRADENPHYDYLKKARFELETELLRLGECTKDIQKLFLARESLTFWEAAFSDKGLPNQPPIKSYVFESITPLLNQFAEEYSNLLTGGAVQVTFNTVTPLKTGELREKFSVDVKNSHGAQSYLGESGGERRRADLIILFSLYSLARVRSGTSIDFLFLDEVLDSLDVEGCLRVGELLKKMSESIDKIFLITHNEHLKQNFNQVIAVEKKNGYSTIVEAA